MPAMPTSSSDNRPCHEDPSDEAAEYLEDIEHIVALASTTGARMPRDAASQLYQDPDNYHYFLPPTPSRREERTARLLDAIAAILATPPGGPGYAVGACVKHHSDPVLAYTRLYLAADEEIIDPSVKTYLGEIWGLMQALCEAYRSSPPRVSATRRQSLREELSSMREEQVVAAEREPGSALNLYDQLARRVYAHSLAKFESRLNKAHAVLQAVEKAFKLHYRPTLPVKPDGSLCANIFSPLLYILGQVNKIRGALDAKRKGGESASCMMEEKKVDLVSPTMLFWVRKIFQLYSLFSMKEVEEMDNLDLPDGKVRKPLSHVMDKLLSVESAIYRLDIATRSQRFYHVIKNSSFDIVCLNNSLAGATPAETPLDAERWGQVFDLAQQVSYSEFHPAEGAKETIIEKAMATQSQPTTKTPSSSSFSSSRTTPPAALVHGECRLLLHFARTASASSANTDTQPVPHIGVSKPSCPACTAVFSAWNQLQSRMPTCLYPLYYKTRAPECSRKWCWPWAMPKDSEWRGSWPWAPEYPESDGRPASSEARAEMTRQQNAVADFWHCVRRKMAERLMFSLAAVGAVEHRSSPRNYFDSDSEDFRCGEATFPTQMREWTGEDLKEPWELYPGYVVPNKIEDALEL